MIYSIQNIRYTMIKKCHSYKRLKAAVTSCSYSAWLILVTIQTLYVFPAAVFKSTTIRPRVSGLWSSTDAQTFLVSRMTAASWSHVTYFSVCRLLSLSIILTNCATLFGNSVILLKNSCNKHSARNHEISLQNIHHLKM